MANKENGGAKLHRTEDGFTTKWGFILACIGSAVGMGNIWRFPIMVSTYGGMTFLIPYIICVALIGSTGVMEEFALGRWAGAGPVGAFGKCTQQRFGSTKPGRLIGALPIIGAMGLAIGYTVVMGWIFKYCFMGLSGSLYALGTDMGAIGGAFGATAPEAETLGEAVSMMAGSGFFGIGNSVWQIVGLVIALVIMALGVAGGIERANKILMPALFGLFCHPRRVYRHPPRRSSAGYKYIFSIQPGRIFDPQVWIYAFGQAFFSLSVAGNGSVIYGSYFSRDEDIPSSARNVAVFDTLAALLARSSFFRPWPPGVEPSKGGPGLMFVYLVNVLNGMAGGRIVGAVFFVCVLFAGITSIINLYEAPVAWLQEQFGVKRLVSVAVIGVIGMAVSLVIQPWTSQWMDVVSIYICPLGAFLAAVMFFWVLKKETAIEAVSEGIEKPIGKWFYPTGKYVYCALTLVALVAGALLGGIG